MILIPAISGVYTIRITKLTLEYLWWRKECPIYTPYVLISYGNLLINPEYQSNIREVAKIDNEVTVMVDSGGLQMYTRGVNIDIESSTRWQLKVGDYILGLDYPLSVKEMFNKEKFLKHAQISATNYKEQLKILGDVAKEKYFAILQGHTNEQL
jgi:hydrogenase maturation factor